MANYAMIASDAVVNVCIWDGITPFDPGGGISLVPLADLPPGVWIGWTKADGGTWSAPPPPDDG